MSLLIKTGKASEYDNKQLDFSGVISFKNNFVKRSVTPYFKGALHLVLLWTVDSV